MLLKILIIEYLIIFLHEITHLICSFILKFKVKVFNVFPFTICRQNRKIRIILSKNINIKYTSKLYFESISLSSSLDYDLLLKRIRKLLWVGPIYDFIIFITFFCIGLSIPEYFFLTLTALLHFCITAYNFFNSDGKYAIGSIEDDRIAFDLIRYFTICGYGDVTRLTKSLLTDRHIKICNTIHWDGFQVNDLWNFLNNISFYTNCLTSNINNDLQLLDDSSYSFFDSLITDFDKIKDYDYRQVPKTSISIILYFIFTKIQYKSFLPDVDIYDKIYKGCNSIYYRRLLNYFFKNRPDYREYLLDERNMPQEYSNYKGYTKLLSSIVNKKII